MKPDDESRQAVAVFARFNDTEYTSTMTYETEHFSQTIRKMRVRR